MQNRAPKGTQDLLPAQAALWNRLENQARAVFQLYGYGEIRTPIFEHTSLFVRSIGEVTDVVEKQMYTFADEDDSITLRPEATASVVRAYLEHALDKQKTFQKLYYIGPMFRRERPQAGRARQFHQVGVEAIGSTDPLLDAETIILANQLLAGFGVAEYQIRLNSIGCDECRATYRELLRTELTKQVSALCEDCRNRIDRNVFRTLDCKREGCRAITREMPAITDDLCEGCGTHLSAVKGALDESGVGYLQDSHLVRGFDYYTGLVYEITCSGLGAQDAVCGGGRYDSLVAQSGGPALGAVGFAMGMERIVLAIGGSEKGKADQASLDVFLVAINATVRPACFRLANALRAKGVSAELDYEGRSVKSQMRTATKLGARQVMLLGPDEMAQGLVKLKDMESGEEQALPEAEALASFS